MLTSEALTLICTISIVATPIAARYGENCVTLMGEQGHCVPVKSCQHSFESMQDLFYNEILHQRESKCNTADQIVSPFESPLLCCPLQNIRMNPDIYDRLKNLRCGNSGLSRKIFNGDPAGLYDFRWMALLKYDGKEPFACGGSLIDERHVLTAAHCLHNFKNLPIAVRLGEYDLSCERDCLKYGKRLKCLDPIQDIAIEKFIVHEDYIYKGIHHDIALVRLSQPVNIHSKSIRPICLPITEELQSNLPEQFLVSGWGKTQFGSPSNVLLWTSLSLQSNAFCEDGLRIQGNLSNEHICAGGDDSMDLKDTCKGDSGSPLFYPSTYVDGVGRAVQYGIVSLGIQRCGTQIAPAIYVNVAHYMQWITDHMTIDDDDDES